MLILKYIKSTLELLADTELGTRSTPETSHINVIICLCVIAGMCAVLSHFTLKIIIAIELATVGVSVSRAL